MSLRKLVRDLRPIDILTGEIAIEVTGVVGVSPALWYFRYIASICLTLHKRLWCSEYTISSCVCFVDRCLYFFFWSLCCLFFDIRILITPLVSSNSSPVLTYLLNE